MVKIIYFEGGEDIKRRTLQEINVKAFMDAGGCPAQAYEIYGVYNKPVCSWFFKAFSQVLREYVICNYFNKIQTLIY